VKSMDREKMATYTFREQTSGACRPLCDHKFAVLLVGLILLFAETAISSEPFSLLAKVQEPYSWILLGRISSIDAMGRFNKYGCPNGPLMCRKLLSST